MAGQVPVNSQEKRCFVYLFIVKPLNNLSMNGFIAPLSIPLLLAG